MGKPWNNQSDDTFEETVVPPRFDQRAVSGARRVVPITDETEEVTRAATRNSNRPQASYPFTLSKPSWPLAILAIVAFVAVAMGAVAIHRRSSSQSQNQEPVSATASTIIDLESDEGPRSNRLAESDGRSSRAGAGSDYDRNDYYAGRGEGRGEDKRRDKDEKWKERDKEREKEGRGRGGDEYRKRFEKAEKDLRRIREMFKGGKD